MERKTLKKWLPLSILVCIMAVAYLNGWQEALDFQTLQDKKSDFLAYTRDHYAAALILFTAAYAVAVALSLPIATLLTLLGGFLFGRWAGTIIVVTAATAGASVIFLIARSAVGKTLREKAGKFYHRIEGYMKEDAVHYMLFMRLVPLFPFFAVNIVPAFFNVSLRAYVLTTFFGIMPGSFVYVNAGEALGDIEKPGDIFSPQMLIAFSLLGLFALLPVLYKKWKGKKPPMERHD